VCALFCNQYFRQPDSVTLTDDNGLASRDKAIIDVNVQRFSVRFAQFEHRPWAEA
jgi:hypothetical protein